MENKMPKQNNKRERANDYRRKGDKTVKTGFAFFEKNIYKRKMKEKRKKRKKTTGRKRKKRRKSRKGKKKTQK